MQGVFTYTGKSGGRKMSGACPGGYTFGFNGQVKDDEVYGEGNSYTAEFWQYDPRLGRRWNVDPKFRDIPQWTPYVAFGNNPLKNIDPDGAWFFGLFGSTKEQRRAAKDYQKQNGGVIVNYFNKNIFVGSSKETLVPKVNQNGVLERMTESTIHQQYFRRDGSLFAENGLYNPDETGLEQFETWLDKEEDTYIEDGLKIVIGLSWDVINAPKVFMTRETITGKQTDEGERLDAASTVFPGPGMVSKSLPFLKGLTKMAKWNSFQKSFKGFFIGNDRKFANESFKKLIDIKQNVNESTDIYNEGKQIFDVINKSEDK